MPERIIKPGILSCDRVNTLSSEGEVFYRRLMSIVDDYGRYDARPAILRAHLFPLKLDLVKESDIGMWIRECDEAGLVRLYSVDHLDYLEIQKFDQRLRAAKSKWPPPPTIAGTRGSMSASCGQPHAPATESETETETESNTRERARACESNSSNDSKTIPGAENDPGTPTTPEIPTLEQVKAYALLPTAAIPASVAVAYFDKMEACGWVDQHGRPVQSWQADLRHYHRCKKERSSGARSSKGGAPSSFGGNLMRSYEGTAKMADPNDPTLKGF